MTPPAPDPVLRVVRVLAVGVALILFALCLRPAAHVYDMPMTEDGYYALAVARNVAQGRGVTIDGINVTNGFQPLFTFLQAGAFVVAGGNEILAMRLVMGLAWLFHAAGAVLVALIARDAWPALGPRERALRAPLAFFLYLASPLMLNHAYNGLETGPVLFFYLALARLMQTGADRTPGGLALFGAVLGLAILARIDVAVLALVLGLNVLRRAWPEGLAAMAARGATIAAAAFVVSLPWWAFNVVHFGTPMPTSGTAQQAWGLEFLRLEFAEWALRLVLVPWIFAGSKETALSFFLPLPVSSGGIDWTLPGSLRFVALAGVAWVLARWRRAGGPARELGAAPPQEALAARRTLEFAACLAAAIALMVVYYGLSFIAYWFYYRYFAPAALFAFVIAPILAARWWAKHNDARWNAFGAALALGLAAHVAVLAAMAQTGKGLGGNTVYHDQVALVRRYVPDGELVAAGQSGTLGFFRANVVNTDGKVNREALAHQDRMWDYLRARGVRWFVDWPFYVNKYLGVPLDADERPAREANGWRLVAEREYFYLYEYVGPP